MSRAQDDNQILALRPPIITGSTELRVPEHYHGGIPIRAVEGDLQIIISPWLVMTAGDKCEMFFGNSSTAVWSKELDDSDVDKQLVFRIPRGFVVEGDAVAFYRVTRVRQEPEDSLPTLIMLVKLRRPGGFDDDTEEGHSGLKYELTPDVSGGVDDVMARNGIKMRVLPYENMAAHDYIIARWGSEEVHYLSVTQEQVDDPVNHPIIITFEEKVITDAGDGPGVAVTFQVIDRVGNYPDERAPWAQITRVEVDVAGNRLPQPTVLVNNRPVNTIDLDQLGDSDLVVRVYTQSPDFAVNDEIHPTWKGMPAQGQPITVTPTGQLVEFVPFQYDFLIPNASVRALAKGSASVSYVRKRAGQADTASKVASVNVIGEISQLAAPAVLEAPGGYLDPQAPWATHEIAFYAGRKSSDQVNLIWEATRPGGGVEYFSDARPVGNVPENTPILRTVTSADIARFNGLQVKVHYTVANDDVLLQNVRDSLPLSLQVGVALPSFAPPTVDEAQDGSLDPEQVPPAGVTLTCPHLGTLAQDRVTYVWRGSGSNGSTSDFVDLTSHSAGSPVRFTVARQFVTANLNGTVAATYTIVRNGQPLGTSGELRLSIGKAQAEVPPPTVIEAPVYVLDPNDYQQGFTVRFDTSKLLATDKIELIVAGRPGDGSTSPEPKTVNGQAIIDFDIAAAITGANLGREVNLNYRAIRAGQDFPAQTRALTIGTLLQRSMPQPLIDGMTGEVMEVGLIKDDSKVVCGVWPFQRRGLPVWLTWVETFAGGGSRTRDQLLGTVHDQESGLSYTAEVDWLRECKDGSTVSIVLKVGLFVGAVLVDAVECQGRSYSVKAGLDDLSTFTGYDWGGWKNREYFESQIMLIEGEYFVESSPAGHVILKKTFEVEIGEQYAFSFDYRTSASTHLRLIQYDRIFVAREDVPASNIWKSKTVFFHSGGTPAASPMTLELMFESLNNIVRVDNLRLKKVLN